MNGRPTIIDSSRNNGRRIMRDRHAPARLAVIRARREDALVGGDRDPPDRAAEVARDPFPAEARIDGAVRAGCHGALRIRGHRIRHHGRFLLDDGKIFSAEAARRQGERREGKVHEPHHMIIPIEK